MAADTTISDVFNLPDGPPPLCDAESCTFLVGYLVDFYQHVVENESEHPWISETEYDDLGKALQTLQATAPHEKIDWMPEYGCAVLKSGGECTSGIIALNLISLDLHRFETISKQLPFGGYHYVDNATSMDYVVQHIGKCALEELEDIQGRFLSKLHDVQSRVGNNRSAQGGKQGHQKTPAFIHALYREALGFQEQLPRGGFTDVGKHTGGQEPRSSAWPVVTASLCQLLASSSSSGGKLFEKIIAYFGLYACEETLVQYDGEVDSNPKTGSPHTLLEDAFHILQSSSRKAAALSDEGFDMSFFRRWSKSIQSQIMERASSQASLYSQFYELPKSDEDIRGHYKNFGFDLPAPYTPSSDSTLSESEILEYTHQNLGWLSLLNEGKSVGEVDNWVKKTMSVNTSHDILPMMLVLKTVEGIMWECAKSMPTMKQDELENIVSIVDNYRDVLHNIKQNGKYKPLSIVQLRSREILVVWVAFCIIHSNAVHLHKSAMNGFGVPLDVNGLSHLVLSDPTEWDVVKHVSVYLSQWGSHKPVFSLKDEKSTFDLGGCVANASPDLVNIWKEEEKDASCRVAKHWEEVVRKQELVRKLRTEIADLSVNRAENNRQLITVEAELAEHERKLSRRNALCASSYDISAYDYRAHSRCQNSVNNLRSTVNNLDSQLSSKNSSLNAALIAPEPVIQPLPRARDDAMPLIFFLHMPPIYKLLARFSFTSQQLLLPQPWESAWGGGEGCEKFDITGQVTRGSGFCQDSWTWYYNDHQRSVYHHPSSVRNGSDSYLFLCTQDQQEDIVPKKYGPQCTTSFKQESDGVWYPDQMSARFAWFGGPKSYDKSPKGSEINPFVEVDHFIVVSNFTERLEKRDSAMQWALMQPGEKYIRNTRGNQPYARQNIKPKWMSKTEYFSFANMRSYPNIQLRNIFVAIQERQLQFTEPSVHTLLEQTLFHIGDVSISNKGALLEWKRDLEHPNFVINAYDILRSFYDEIKDSPKNYMCVKLLGKLCNFFSHWEPKCRRIAQQLAKSVCQWADDFDGEVEEAPPASAPVIRAKQVVLYHHATMVLVGGEDLIDDDISLLLKMIVKSKNHFTGDNRLNEIRGNATEVQYALCQKLDDILEAARRSPFMITDAFRSVVESCPVSLKWQPWTPNSNVHTQCFYAKDDDGYSYSINLLTGELLVDGLPPSRLPLSILNNTLYKRTFGDRNFEVIGKGSFLETSRPIFNRFYWFSKGSDLRIYEFKEDKSEMLELLDGTSDGSSDIPPRLKSMHSHWLYRERNIIVLRGVSYKNRNISFLVQLKELKAKISEGQVSCVEIHSKNRDQLLYLVKNMPAMDTLVLHQQSRALDIISKFEPREYIHSMISETNVLRFYCPRYEMSFELNDGVLHCREIAGYQLMHQQQLGGTLRGVKMYFLLEEVNGSGKLIIFPKGKVVRRGPGDVSISVKDDCDEQLLWYQYTFHPRFQYIETQKSQASRMQLAALHLATSSALPDELLSMTGEERAVTLIRQSWGNRPLSVEECLALNNLKQLARGFSPTLSLLCEDIELSSKQLHFLYLNDVSHDHVVVDSFEGTAYLKYVESNQFSSRCYLTSQEEDRLMGSQARKSALPPRFVPDQQLSTCPIDASEIELLQNRLDKCIISTWSSKADNREESFPLPLSVNSTSKLELDMMNELKESWDAHMSISPRHSVDSKSSDSVEALKDLTSYLREKVEGFVLNALNQVPETSFHWHCNAHDILRTVGLVPTATAADLAKVAMNPSVANIFNPMLTLESREKLVESILTWLRLCVYEDKLGRLVSFFGSGSLDEITRELDTVTVWDTAKHPYWLVFEVENRIQIRQEQYKVAQHLIDNPGDVIQLNMGLGKTRVIIPMLVLHWSFSTRDKITRLHYLSALFEEAYGYLQNHLCASILGIKIYTMPFCRDFKLEKASVIAMKNALRDCRLDGGALAIAPEHRLSLELNTKELYYHGENELAELIDKNLIQGDLYHDILDESDEILRHRYQLIYSMGMCVALPSRTERWGAVQAIFEALVQNDELKEYLSSQPKSCKMTSEAAKSKSEWSKLQFFDGETLKDMISGLLPKLADAILSKPPREVAFMRDHPLKNEIRKAMIEEEYYPAALNILPEHHLCSILALRGFLAGGILEHCLMKRHRVDYGVARPGKKRLAVPFRSADTPNLRSEFAHPDCAIAFTTLAYYHDGLTKENLLQALKSLFALGENAQRMFYSSWFKASLHQMSDEEQASLDSIEKIDMTNDIQMEKMWQYYHGNMYTINFYLNTCVLPEETSQFTRRLTATSWNIAQNPSNNIVGFSGTNDNYRILPLQVRQYFASKENDSDPVLTSLDGTNGRMLTMMIEHTLAVRQLDANVKCSEALVNILEEGIEMHAIIDCGALLAGVDLYELSKRILSLLRVKDFGGVLFYDSVKHKDFMILERSGRILRKDISPIKEDNVFAIFDEPRCRGTDLKLRPNAVALLTLAPKICKDKLMQAAGRLRKLGHSQKLVIAGGPDVFSKLAHNATTANVLSWAMKNTVESTALGLPNWVNQGCFFTSTFGKDPRYAVTDEHVELEAMYGKSFTHETVDVIASKAHLYHIERTGGEDLLHGTMKEMVELIHQQANTYGPDFIFSSSGRCDEECEREVELEIEEEEEAENEVQLMDAANEKVWDFERVLTCESPGRLSIGTSLISSFIERSLTNKALAKVKWAKEIYATENFLQTVVCQDGDALDSYLRTVNFVLRFPAGSLLLLSEFEANHLLKIFWNMTNTKGHHLLHSSLLRRSLDSASEVLLQCSGNGFKAKDVISEISMASLQLFSGETTYATKHRKEALKSVLRVQKTSKESKFCPRADSLHLVGMRGVESLYPCSDLEAIGDELLCELQAAPNKD